MDDIWGRACTHLERSVGANNFNHWIKPLRLAGMEDGVAEFVAPTRFLSDWVNRHFAPQILQELSRSGAPVDRLRFAVRSDAPARTPVPRPAAPAAPPQGAAPVDLGAPLDSRFTFENFVGCLLYTSPSPRD